MVAQMDANVKKPFRRLGIATAVYDLGRKIAQKHGAQLIPAPDGSDDARHFWASQRNNLNRVDQFQDPKNNPDW